ncbi:MAG: PAS domain-containing protein [Rhizomicrobium sp.]|jgi:hypothetical protein
MKHKNSHLLVGYWSRLRRGRDVPDQSDIDPRAIKRMLSQIFILEASDPARPAFRLAGTWLCDRFGFELKGTGFLGTWEARSRESVALLLRQSLASKQPVCVSSIGATADSAMVEIELVLAPMSFGGNGATRFLGMIQFLGESGNPAGRPIAFQRLVGSTFLNEDEPLSSVPPAPPAPPPPMGRSHPRAPHLRLVISRDQSAVLNFDMDEMMRNLISALEITRQPRLSLLRG